MKMALRWHVISDARVIRSGVAETVKALRDFELEALRAPQLKHL